MSKLLRLDLPDDVWLRLNAEAEIRGMKIGAYTKHLIMTRDARRIEKFLETQTRIDLSGLTQQEKEREA